MSTVTDPVAFWQDEILANRSASTRRVYGIYLAQFLDFLDQSAETVIQQRKHDVQHEDIQIHKRYENQLKKFDAALEKRGLTPASRRYAWASVKSFFHAFNLDLRLDRSDVPKGKSEEMRAITKPEIRRLLTIADARGQALIYTLKDTGLRASDIARLRLGDVDLEAEYPMIKLRTKKRGIIAKTFLGPEAQTMLQQYLTTRQYGTDTIPAEQVSKTSPLFRQDYTTVKPIRSNAISTYFARLKATAQLPDISTHSFRRFFEIALEAAGVHPNWIDRMIGHRLVASRGSYSKPTDNQLREAYIKAYDYLRVNEPAFDHERMRRLEESRLRERTERQQLTEKVLNIVNSNLAMQTRIHDLERENAALHDGIADLQRKNEELAEQLDQIMPFVNLFTGPTGRELFERLHRGAEVRGGDTAS